MKAFNIKVTEYGLKKGETVYPSHYTWDYCIQKRIPYIIIRPKIRYSNIDYDLLTINKGLAFKNGISLIDHWWKLYEEYVNRTSFPRNRIPLRIIGVITDNFTVFKKDQETMVNILMKEIEKFVNDNGIIDVKRKRYYDNTKEANEIAKSRDMYF
ncbi:MAG: hypothetical protein ACOYM7_08440 [Paludibacter sp.]